MAKAHRLTSHKAQKAPKTKLIRAHHHGHITKRLHGRKRAQGWTRHAKTVSWATGVHKPHIPGGTRHPGVRHAGTHPTVAGHRAKAAPATAAKHRKPLTAATRAKISAALKGKHHAHHGQVVHHVAGSHKLSAATKAKIAAALKGRHHKGHPMSAAARAKLSAALKGRHHKGHPMSPAARAKLSSALKGKHHPGHKGSHKGHKQSAATRSKIAAKLRGRHVTRRKKK
jgi:hypothetical protein